LLSRIGIFAVKINRGGECKNERDSELTFTWFSARKELQYEGTTKQVFLRIFLCASMQHTGTQQSIEHHFLRGFANLSKIEEVFSLKIGDITQCVRDTAVMLSAAKQLAAQRDRPFAALSMTL
jgi:hypothetical protein